MPKALSLIATGPHDVVVNERNAVKRLVFDEFVFKGETSPKHPEKAHDFC